MAQRATRQHGVFFCLMLASQVRDHTEHPWLLSRAHYLHKLHMNLFVFFLLLSASPLSLSCQTDSFREDKLRYHFVCTLDSEACPCSWPGCDLMQALVCILPVSCMWLCGPQETDLAQTWVSSPKGPWESRLPVETGRAEDGSGMLCNDPVSQRGEGGAVSPWLENHPSSEAGDLTLRMSALAGRTVRAARGRCWAESKNQSLLTLREPAPYRERPCTRVAARAEFRNISASLEREDTRLEDATPGALGWGWVHWECLPEEASLGSATQICWSFCVSP